MGLSAEVIARGPFRRELLPFLNHPAGRYAGTREGAILIEQVFYTPQGTQCSEKLAACMGVDAWDRNTHAFDPWRVNLDREVLYEIGVEERRIKAFLAFREAGFTFYFLPNY